MGEELARERRRTELPELPSPGEAEGFAELLRALRKLSPNQRAAIVLRYVEDLEMSEVARRIGTTSATVRVHIHRGRKHLAQLLREGPQ